MNIIFCDIDSHFSEDQGNYSEKLERALFKLISQDEQNICYTRQ